ncbi:MAG: c-type cytochrome [bacterium]
MKKYLITAIVLAAFSTNAWALGDAVQGKEKSTVCGSCHAPDGNSNNTLYPKLAGQHADYIYHSLKAYKDGSRNNPIMKGMAAGLSDDDMKNIAQYFSEQKSNLAILPKK